MRISSKETKEIFNSLKNPNPGVGGLLHREMFFSKVSFSDLDDEAKCELARLFVLDSCPRSGACFIPGDVFFFLSKVAEEIESWPSNRHVEHVAFAIATMGRIPPSEHLHVLASVYLLRELFPRT